MSLDIKSRHENDAWIVKLTGELDISCAEELKNVFDKNIEEKFLDIRVDMSNLQYIDSTGVGIIVGAMKKLRNGGKDIFLQNPRDNVKKIFRITGLDQIINMEG